MESEGEVSRDVTLADWMAEFKRRAGCPDGGKISDASDPFGVRFRCHMEGCGYSWAIRDAYPEARLPIGGWALNEGPYTCPKSAYFGGECGLCDRSKGASFFTTLPVRVVKPDGTYCYVYEFAEEGGDES